MSRPIILSLFSALLYILSFPNFNFSWLAWVALVPLARAVIHQTPRRAFVTGWLAGTAATVGLLYWIIVTFQAAQQSIFLSVPCLLFLSAYLGLYWGVWTICISWTARSLTPTPSPNGRGEKANDWKTLSLWERVPPREWRGVRLPLFAAAAWVGLEYLRTHLFSGFPWTLLADSQWQHLPLIQVASITGVYGVSFLIVLVNTTLAWTLKKGNRTPFLTAGLVALTLLYGGGRLRSYSMEPGTPSLKVALLQGSIDQYQKWDQRYTEEIKQTYETLLAQAALEKPRLIVWPETSVPGYLLEDPPLRAWLQRVVQRTGAHHLVGAPATAPHRLAYNSAYSLSPKGEILGQYSKRHLVPFGEVIPFSSVLGRWIGVLNELGGFAAGTESPVLESGIGPIGVNICYEAIFPDLVRRSVRAGAGVIVNLTNDGWYLRTAAPYQHFIPNVFRAVENGRWVVRANNTGITALIDPQGRVVSQSGIFVPTVVTGNVIPKRYLTFYTRHGDVFAWGCLVLCFVLPLRGILRRQ